MTVTWVFVFRTTVCALLACGAMACGLVEDSTGDAVIPIRSRWLFLRDEDALTLVKFDDPRAPRVDRRPLVEGCCSWTPDGKRALLLGGTPETSFVAEAPDWEPSPLPFAEDYDLAHFLNSTHFVAWRLFGPQNDEVEWVFRDVDGTSFIRFGWEESVATYGLVGVLRDEELLLVREDLSTVTLPAPGLQEDHLGVRLEDEGQHVVLTTWLEDAVDFGPLPDFVSHVEAEVSPSCLDDPVACRPTFASVTWVEEAELLVGRCTWPIAAGEAGRLVLIRPGEKMALGPPELTDESVIAEWVTGEGDAWVDGPSGRVRWVTSDSDAGRWTVKERNVLDLGADWVTIAEGPGSWVDTFYVDFGMIWLEDDGIFSALDLASGRGPVPVGPLFPRSLGWQRRALVFEEESPIPCYGPCSYVAYADPSDPDAPVVHGELDAISDNDYAWTPDGSGLLLRTEGWLVYHAFAAPDEPFRLAPISDDTLVEVPPVW